MPWKQCVIGAAGFGVVLVHFLLFMIFFYNPRHSLGHDYGIVLPQLLDGYFWFRNNGIDDVFWFTPALCGGVPAFPHPIHFYYSVPQFLTFITNPLNAVAFTFIIFGAAGFWGFYFLLRRILLTGVTLSFFGGVLFLFNGFYVYRLAIGHLTYHSFMLIPWCALFLLLPAKNSHRQNLLRSICFSIITGIMMGYMIYSGLQTVLPPVFLSIVLVCLTAGLFLENRFDIRSFVIRLMMALLVMAGLSAAKVSAVLHFLHQMPRTHYPLPQFPELADLMMVMVKSLFFFPAWEQAQASMVNMQLILNRHEFEFGLTVVPLVFLLIGLVYLIYRGVRKQVRMSARGMLLCSGVLLICLLPIVVNVYTPGWNRFLKQVPLINSSTQFTRWFCMYIPFLVLLTAMVVNRLPVLNRRQVMVSVLGMGCVIAVNAHTDETYYVDQPYSPMWIVNAYDGVRNTDADPAITNIAVCMNADGRIGGPAYRNDSIVYGQSQFLCYDSMFGYGLESFPVQTLEPGSVFKETGGRLNMKNPACYVFPEANGCLPGEHFTIDEKAAVIAFTHYRPYPFHISMVQKGANCLTLLSLMGVSMFLVFCWIRETVVFWQRKTGSRAGMPEGC